jgi:uncharacterized protein
VDFTTRTMAGLTRRDAMRRIGGTVGAATGLAITGRETTAMQAEQAGTPVVPPDFKVVLHAAEEQNWPYVLSNLRNLTQEWPRAHLRVVVDGTAVYTLQGENDLTTELAKMDAAGVEVHVCPNALHEHQIDPTTIPSYAQTSLGGVVALVLAQHEGFVYVKP